MTVGVSVCLKFVMPVDVRATFDSTKRSVRLCWNVLDTSFIRGYAVFKTDYDDEAAGRTVQLPGGPFTASCITDSLGTQDRTCEYRVASLLKNERATVTSDGVMVSPATTP